MLSDKSWYNGTVLLYKDTIYLIKYNSLIANYHVKTMPIINLTCFKNVLITASKKLPQKAYTLNDNFPSKKKKKLAKSLSFC